MLWVGIKLCDCIFSVISEDIPLFFLQECMVKTEAFGSDIVYLNVTRCILIIFWVIRLILKPSKGQSHEQTTQH